MGCDTYPRETHTQQITLIKIIGTLPPFHSNPTFPSRVSPTADSTQHYIDFNTGKPAYQVFVGKC